MDLFILAAVVACIARTVTQEEIFREWRERMVATSKDRRVGLLGRKGAYVWTCEYCFSHWVAIFVLIATGYRLDPWGFIVTTFVLVWVANVYMRLFQWLTLLVIWTRKAGQPPTYPPMRRLPFPKLDTVVPPIRSDAVKTVWRGMMKGD